MQGVLGNRDLIGQANANVSERKLTGRGGQRLVPAQLEKVKPGIVMDAKSTDVTARQGNAARIVARTVEYGEGLNTAMRRDAIVPGKGHFSDIANLDISMH
jgi:hypothetical protein